MAVRVFDSFEDPAPGHAIWEAVAADGATDTVFQRLDWQREWWRAYGGDRLLLIAAEAHGSICALAPLFALDGMVFLIGSGESDRLDFIGRVDAPALAAMLAAAREAVPGFEGIALSQIPAASPTDALLVQVAARLDLELHREGDIGAPYLDLTDPEAVARALESRRLTKAERRMGREGPLRVRRASEGDLDPWLERFFAQHTARWKDAGDAQFTDPRHRDFWRAIVHRGHRGGWLRFSMLEWNGEAAAFDITVVHKDTHVALLISRDPAIIRHSPGRILERHMIRAAIESGARRYEHGIGDDPHKLAHSSAVPRVVSWQLWPR